MLYQITYNIFDDDRKESFLHTISSMGASIALFPNVRIIDSEKDAKLLFNSLVTYCAPGDSVFITPINMLDVQGFLKRSDIEWMFNRSELNTKETNLHTR